MYQAVLVILLLTHCWNVLAQLRPCTVYQRNETEACPAGQYCYGGTCDDLDGKRYRFRLGRVLIAKRCVTNTGRALPDAYENMPVCQEYSSLTCCDTSWLKYMEFQVNRIKSKYTGKCVELATEYLCMMCNPQVGVGQKSLQPCKSTCDELYEACNENYYYAYGMKCCS